MERVGMVLLYYNNVGQLIVGKGRPVLMRGAATDLELREDWRLPNLVFCMMLFHCSWIRILSDLR